MPNDSTRSRFSDFLRRALAERGMTQEDLGRKVGLPRTSCKQQVSLWATGVKRPSERYLLLIGLALGLSLEELAAEYHGEAHLAQLGLIASPTAIRPEVLAAAAELAADGETITPADIKWMSALSIAGIMAPSQATLVGLWRDRDENQTILEY